VGVTSQTAAKGHTTDSPLLVHRGTPSTISIKKTRFNPNMTYGMVRKTMLAQTSDNWDYCSSRESQLGDIFGLCDTTKMKDKRPL